MPLSTEFVVAPMEAVVRLEVAQPVDHVEHREAQREESSGDLVNSEGIRMTNKRQFPYFHLVDQMSDTCEK